MIKIRTIINVSTLFVLCFFSLFTDATARVRLRVVDARGNELEQAQVGRTFVLEVSIDGDKLTAAARESAGTSYRRG